MKKNSVNSQKNSQRFGQIMGINVNSTEIVEVLVGVENFISCNTKFSIVTPNPELILMAQNNKNLKNALNSANLSIPDGFGLKFANPKLNIIKGRELFLELIKLAAKKNWKVFLLGGMGNEAKLATTNLKYQISNLKIKFNKGPMLGYGAKPRSVADKKIESDTIDQINKFAPELLFVAFGNPKQEIWIHKNLSRLNVSGAMAVGGTFRYIAGMSKLPPEWMAENGLEWFYRLMTEPKRFLRILRAVVLFPLRSILYIFLQKPKL